MCVCVCVCVCVCTRARTRGVERLEFVQMGPSSMGAKRGPSQEMRLESKMGQEVMFMREGQQQ